MDKIVSRTVRVHSASRYIFLFRFTTQKNTRSDERKKHNPKPRQFE